MASKVQFTVQYTDASGRPETSTFTATHCGGVRSAEGCARRAAEMVKRAAPDRKVEVFRRADGYSEGELILSI